MKKLFKKAVQWYRDWKISNMQCKLEAELEPLFVVMYRAAIQLQVFRNLNTYYDKKKAEEARITLEQILACFNKCLPICSEYFQIKAREKIRQVIWEIR